MYYSLGLLCRVLFINNDLSHVYIASALIGLHFCYLFSLDIEELDYGGINVEYFYINWNFSKEKMRISGYRILTIK